MWPLAATPTLHAEVNNKRGFGRQGPYRADNIFKRKDGSTFAGNLHAWAVRIEMGNSCIWKVCRGYHRAQARRRRNEKLEARCTRPRNLKHRDPGRGNSP